MAKKKYVKGTGKKRETSQKVNNYQRFFFFSSIPKRFSNKYKAYFSYELNYTTQINFWLFKKIIFALPIYLKTFYWHLLQFILYQNFSLGFNITFFRFLPVGILSVSKWSNDHLETGLIQFFTFRLLCYMYSIRNPQII